MVELTEKFLIIIILIFAFLSLFSLFNYHLVWWDEAVYVGMGKYIYSNGSIGIFEEIRPLILPIFLGFFWVVNIDPLISGRVLILFSTLLNIYLVYLIGKKLFDPKIGIFASLLLAFTPLFYNYSFLSLTGIFSTTFALLSIYFFIHERNLKNISLSAFFLGISFLTRFPQGIILICFLIFLLYKKEFKNIISLLMVFLLTISPYLIFNFLQYGSIFEPFIKASEIITDYGWLYSGSPLFYIKELFFQNFLLLFALVSPYYIFKEKKGTPIFLILVSFIIFFSIIIHKELRYSLIFLPYLCLLSSKTIFSLKLTERTKNILMVLFLIFLFLNFSTNFHFASGSYQEDEIKFYSGFSKGEIIYSTTPLIAYFSDAKVIPMYTVLGKTEEFIKREKPNKIFFSDSFPCDTQSCENRKKNLIKWMRENYDFTYYEDKKLYFFVR